MTRRNCTSTLRRRNRSHPMRSYDALPPDLRRWLAGAALPWSAASALKVWQRSLRRTRGDGAAALRLLTQVEQRLLCRDVARIWGADHPFLTAGAPQAQAPQVREPLARDGGTAPRLTR